jgi:hypothetical protein
MHALFWTVAMIAGALLGVGAAVHHITAVF